MQGQLFTQDFLLRGVLQSPPYLALDDDIFLAFKTKLKTIYAPITATSTINEAQTESELIAPTLDALGFSGCVIPQVNLSSKGREDVPDYLLFGSNADKLEALQEKADSKRYPYGLTIVEAKRWMRPLDRSADRNANQSMGGAGVDQPLDFGTPSSQMLRYLSRTEIASNRRVLWGVLTNGNIWRLYWQSARSRAEEFFEIDLAAALELRGASLSIDDAAEGYTSDHLLKLFYLFFHQNAFLPQSFLPLDTEEWRDGKNSFHAYALNEARLYEARVAENLGERVFTEVFPRLATAIAASGAASALQGRDNQQAKQSAAYSAVYLDEVRETTLVVLYRLLFLFYAEDRNLLPVRDKNYHPYSLRFMREEIRDKRERKLPFSSVAMPIWNGLQGLFQAIDEGDDSIGIPEYNGGLFAKTRAPLLARIRIPDSTLAPLLDALSREVGLDDLLAPRWINYRDLSVAHLGSIYERLLDYALTPTDADPAVLRAIPASFARKVSGSYYTHNDLVRLVLRESVGTLANERIAKFEDQVEAWANKRSLGQTEWQVLDGEPDLNIPTLDPASSMLALKICDPAMGSGHFLVSLVDDMADRVLEAMTSAELLIANQHWAKHLAERGRPWVSPLVARIAAIRASIKATAKEHGWAIPDEQLDDRHIVRRMVLKKCVFGVDKNAMAVELAKTALWLHTFTVGAPLSFLDHHLRVGDSLHGERVETVQGGLQAFGGLFKQNDWQRLALAAKNIAQVADLTDADIAEAHLSKELNDIAQREIAPIQNVLDFWRAMRWLVAGWPVAKIDQLPKLMGLPKDRQAAQALLDADAQSDTPEFSHYRALQALLSPEHDLVELLGQDYIEFSGADGKRDSATTDLVDSLIARTRRLAKSETFFHWWTSFPTVFGSQQGADKNRGFDAVIGNPPWDRIKLQEVEWFAERVEAVAMSARASDRKALIAKLKQEQSPLYAEYLEAQWRAEANARVLGNGKQGSEDYPLLGGGDVNLYSLFIERAQSLVKPTGLVALITPSGIAADKGASEFFKSISTTQRLGAFFDFENKKFFFKDVHASFKFCALVFGGFERTYPRTRYAAYVHSVEDLFIRGGPKNEWIKDSDRVLSFNAADFARVNPNTGAAPIFRNPRDAQITLAVYAQHPVLVKHGATSETLGLTETVKTWPVKYSAMFHMTNDSHLFLREDELKAKGFKRSELNRWVNKKGEDALPLYEGKMVQMYDHRAADVVVNLENLKRAAQQESIESQAKQSSSRFPVPQYRVLASEVDKASNAGTALDWCIAYKSVTAPSNMRTMIAALIPKSGVGNSMALLLPEANHSAAYTRVAPLLLANINSMAYDFVLRQKVQGQNLNWYIIEQTAVIDAAAFDKPLPRKFVKKMREAKLMNGYHDEPTVADCVIPQVLALTYTAHDMAAFATDLGFVDKAGVVLPPFVWDETERRARMAALDAVFFYLYGLDADDAAYIMDSFPIVREQDIKAFGQYQTRVDVLAWLRLLES